MMSEVVTTLIIMACSLVAGVAIGWALRGDQKRRQRRRVPWRPPPDYIGRPPTCANGVEGCAIKRPHSHAEALMRRIKEQ